MDEVERLLAGQDGVVSRRQLLGCGLAKHDIDRLLRRRELARVHPGVFVAHTGPLSPRQRAWAAVLYAAPAALYLESASALPADGPVSVAIDATRRVRSRDDVRVHRVVDLDRRAQWNLSPPRVRVEDNTIARAGGARDELEVIELLTTVVGSRLSTPARLREALHRHGRVRHRALLVRLLHDLELGTCSVLEHGYLTRVERPHGLPRAGRQRLRKGTDGSEYRDVEYEEFGLVVELDGRVGHAGWVALGQDADRDLDDHADGREVVRLRWLQVFGSHCRTADRVGRILVRRGWSGRTRRCGPGCTVSSTGA